MPLLLLARDHALAAQSLGVICKVNVCGCACASECGFVGLCVLVCVGGVGGFVDVGGCVVVGVWLCVMVRMLV